MLLYALVLGFMVTIFGAIPFTDALVARLPEQQRRAVRLVKLDELSVREAAAETGLSETAVKVNVHRGIKNLMRLVARDGKA